MNNIINSTGVQDNIFDYRLKEYDNIIKHVKDMLNDLGYEIVSTNYMLSDPTYPSTIMNGYETQMVKREDI